MIERVTYVAIGIFIMCLSLLIWSLINLKKGYVTNLYRGYQKIYWNKNRFGVILVISFQTICLIGSIMLLVYKLK